MIGSRETEDVTERLRARRLHGQESTWLDVAAEAAVATGARLEDVARSGRAEGAASRARKLAFVTLGKRGVLAVTIAAGWKLSPATVSDVLHRARISAEIGGQRALPLSIAPVSETRVRASTDAELKVGDQNIGPDGVVEWLAWTSTFTTEAMERRAAREKTKHPHVAWKDRAA